MSRLIDADRLKRQALFGITNDGIGMHVVTIEQIDAQPTIEAVPVKHGKWEEAGVLLEDKNNRYLFEEVDGYQCSQCGQQTLRPFYFCPRCGAKMDEVSE